MTVTQIHKALRLVLDKNASGVDFGGCPAFLPKELDQFLNLAYLEVISNKFNGTGDQIGFEQTSKRIADLQGLVETATMESTDTTSNIVEFGMFPGWLYVSAILHFGSNQSVCDLVNHQVANRFLKTYNNDPWIERPIITLENNILKVYIDTNMTSETYTLDITYVKKPTIIDSSEPYTTITEVPESVLYEVINRAAIIALENIESLRTQIKAQLNTLEE